MGGLDAYRAKRDFARTAEPPPPARAPTATVGPLTFVVQKHAARALHYDVRIELDGVLKSWPIPKGPSYDPRVKRLAVMTEDHPLDYATFEGVIPRGEYGGGQVIVWDAGIYAPEVDGRPCWDRDQAEERVRFCIQRGKLSIFLHGRKLRGAWTFIRTSAGEWLCRKKDDGTANPARDVIAQDASILSGLTIEDLKAGRLPDGARHGSLLERPADLHGAAAAPFLRPLSPMLPTPSDQPFSHPEWLFEPKLDGFRVLVMVNGGQPRLFSRRELDVTAQYPWLARELERQPYRNIVLDGEIVALDEQGRPSFQLMQNRASDPDQALVYYAFDLLYRDDTDIRGAPLEQRRALLERTVVPTDRVRVVEAFAGDGRALYDAALSHGMEGIVAKRRDSRYETARRSSAWLKVKATQTHDFVVGGYTQGDGARSDTFGSLLLGYFTPGARGLTYAGHVGTGFDDRTLRQVVRRLASLKTSASPFAANVPKGGRWGGRRFEGPTTWVQPALVAEVKYAQRTEDGILRTPVFVRLRDDKPPAEAGPLEPITPRCGGDAPSGVDAWATRCDRVLEQLDGKQARLVVDVDGHRVTLTNLDKVLWPAHEDQRPLTKRDLLRYLVGVAPALLRHLRDRPLTLVRYPNGIGGVHFYQKHYDHSRPAFVETVRLYSDHNAGDGDYILCNNLPTLVWLGQIADLEFHTWYSRTNPEPDARGRPTSYSGSLETMLASVLNYPDFLVFDLDPYLYSGQEARGAEPELHRGGFAATCEVALWLKEILDSLSLASFVKTTGKTGLHIYVPIARDLDYQGTHAIAETLARFLVQRQPQRVTMEWAVSKRTGKVFADYNQNVRGKTLASIYSPRILPWAAVSMPIAWDEVGKVFPTDFTILTAPARLKERGDLWSAILDSKRDLQGLLTGALPAAG